MAANDKKLTHITIERRSSKDSLDVRTPRAARFAEATSVHSPIDPPRSPVEYPTNHYKPQPQIADTGFGYMQSVEMEETDRRYLPPPTPKTPLKSALKSPGAPPRTPAGAMSIMSPTFREEQQLEKREALTEKEQAKDLKIKVRVRLAKIFLRGVNFACSLIVLSMVATAFAIFNATKTLAPRNGLPPWANNTKTWPQILLLTIACISLVMSILVIIAYWRGGHHRAEKVAAYYTVFAVGFFIFSIVMWGVGAAVFNQSKAQNNKTCGNWALVCCIIEVVIEVLVIAIYGIVFYRFWSKRKLRKSMAMRDRARSDLYLAQLRSQSAPNTPGFGPMSPRSGGWRPPPGHPMYVDPHSAAENGESDKVQYAYAREIAQPQPFTLQAPPIKVTSATPKVEQEGFEAPARTNTVSPPLPSPAFQERRNDHVAAAPGEQQYAAVPIPGAYTPLASPSYPPPQQQQPQPAAGFDFGPNVTGQR
ncbi:hypothetical protein COCMIDRAFT_5497 [Bipolaris oryzae ATCC 44560]|uniref:MARVEL domain-containing protein n=1 Tax=Bipolaris oryzae ATCC 44560 TaxID=930090 RepID=W6ZCY5_COCMI|nr:uncharacterized protein COCMIDRAFT_5497 [Bipolaris oryzae ATCC 44560]EUC45294.1 hypothetical protein COCMIDRAFT_5497 [Bipolaris oryzae ATCC 44560]